MPDQDELSTFVEYDGGTYIEGVEVELDGPLNRRRYLPPYIVHIDEETTLKRDHYRMAKSLGALAEAYDDLDMAVNHTIPIPVAISGKPAIASYLHGAQERNKPEIAEIMDVREDTVRKYLNRFDPHSRA